MSYSKIGLSIMILKYVFDGNVSSTHSAESLTFSMPSRLIVYLYVFFYFFCFGDLSLDYLALGIGCSLLITFSSVVIDLTKCIGLVVGWVPLFLDYSSFSDILLLLTLVSSPYICFKISC
jgi:hypothetical protein